MSAIHTLLNLHPPYELCLNPHPLHAYMLISSLHQPCTPIPTSWFSHLPYTICCIMLYVSVSVLPLVKMFMIFSYHQWVGSQTLMLWCGSHAICHLQFSLLSFVYISSSLCPMYYNFAHPALCHPPPSPFSSWYFSASLYLYLVILNSEVLAHAGAVYLLPHSLVKPLLHTRWDLCD